jgi:hypothetical protein
VENAADAAAKPWKDFVLSSKRPTAWRDPGIWVQLDADASLKQDDNLKLVEEQRGLRRAATRAEAARG